MYRLAGSRGFIATLKKMSMNRLLAQLINKWHKNDENRIVAIYGTAGVGKSSYAIQTCLELADVYKGYDPKEWILFKPKDFIDKVTYLYDNNIRVPAIIWDDAGVWLYKFDYQNEFVKGAVKFINVARTVASCIILTTISLNMLVTNLRKMDIMTVKVVRRGHSNTSLAKGYSHVITPNGYRLLKTVFEDEFNRYMPDDVYEWYNRYRRSYVKEAIELMKSSVQTQIDNNIVEYYDILLNDEYKDSDGSNGNNGSIDSTYDSV
jgi:hypothetical protein